MSHAESVGVQLAGALPRPFGQYLLLDNFARGGMGEVYLAKSDALTGLERYCVLKKLRAELTRDREYVTRFIDEARVVVTLSHANICQVFDVGRVAEEYYLAMEYISGRDVRTVQDRACQSGGALPPATALHLVCETLEALDYAHRRSHPLTGEPLNLVHRDVSPQNILVSYEGEVKLIDFGLAVSKLKVERTQPNVVMGKMAYMAPEHARGDHVDARADLFACGVLAYELLSGERFYQGMSASEIWQVAGKGSFRPRRWAALDAELAGYLGKALHPDPQQRFATCGALREVLAGHLHQRFKGTGGRMLREVMRTMFSDELRTEHDLLTRLGPVTAASFEGTRSQSVSLARAEETAPTALQLVRDEHSTGATATVRNASVAQPRSESAPEHTELVHLERPMHVRRDRRAASANAASASRKPLLGAGRNRLMVAAAVVTAVALAAVLVESINERDRDAIVPMSVRAAEQAPADLPTVSASASAFSIATSGVAGAHAGRPVEVASNDKRRPAKRTEDKRTDDKKTGQGAVLAPPASDFTVVVSNISKAVQPGVRLTRQQALVIGARCRPCAGTYLPAAPSTRDGPVIDELRKCIEKKKCR